MRNLSHLPYADITFSLSNAFTMTPRRIAPIASVSASVTPYWNTVTSWLKIPCSTSALL